MSKDIDFVRLQLEPLAMTVQANARAWVKELGRLLNESAKQNLMSLKMEMEVFRLAKEFLSNLGITGQGPVHQSLNMIEYIVQTTYDEILICVIHKNVKFCYSIESVKRLEESARHLGRFEVCFEGYCQH